VKRALGVKQPGAASQDARKLDGRLDALAPRTGKALSLQTSTSASDEAAGQFRGALGIVAPSIPPGRRWFCRDFRSILAPPNVLRPDLQRRAPRLISNT
jgi:hypothetical protein